jgi:hypothetical protein
MPAGVALATAGSATVPAKDAASTATAAVAIRRIVVPFARDLLIVNCRATGHLTNPEPASVDDGVHDRDLNGPDRRGGVLHEQRVIHRADQGRLCGLVVDEQERRVFRREEIVGERVAHPGRWS